MRRPLFLLALTMIYACKSDLSNTKKEKNNLPPNIEIAKNIEVYYSENALKSALLTAPVMMREQDSVNKTTFPNGIKLDMFNPDGTLGSTLTSKYGEMDHLTNQMIAKDSVVVNSTNGQNLRCQDLIWKQNERMLTTYGKVALQTPTEIIYGDTLIADENLKIYRIKKVTGIAQVKK